MVNNGMTVKFRSRCEFVFEGWDTVEGDYSTFMMACTMVMFYCILHMNLLTLKMVLPNNKLVQLGWYFVYAVSGIFVMLLIMTMNGFVNMAVIAGSVVGYVIQVTVQEMSQKEMVLPPGGCEFCA